MKRRNRKLRKIVCFIFLLVVILVISFSPFLFIDIKLIGNKVIDLDYGEKYSEPGFKAYLFNKDITDDIVFEMELIKSIDINIDYILALVKKYHESNMQNKEILVTINKTIMASPDLRNKKDLILTFKDSLNKDSNI